MKDFASPSPARRAFRRAVSVLALAAAATAAHAVGFPPPVPDIPQQRYVDPRLGELTLSEQRLTVMLHCASGSVLRYDRVAHRFMCEHREEQTAAPRCPRPDLSALHALQFTADVCSRRDVAIPPRAPLIGVPVGSYEYLPATGLRNGLSYVNSPDQNGWELQIDASLSSSDRYRRTVTTYTTPTL